MLYQQKTLNNIDMESTKKNVPDVETFGPDLFKLASKANSKNQGWMKSTKVCNLPDGCLVQISTQQGDNVAESVTYVPGTQYDFDKKEFVRLVQHN